MNASFIGSVTLATGQSSPFTGNWVNVTDARNAMIVVFGSGVTSNITANIQAKTSLFGDSIFNAGGAAEGVPIYSFSPVTNGYSSPAFLDSPVTQIRVVATGGTGQLFAYAAIQN